MEKKVKVGEREIVVRELTYLQGLELIDLSKKEIELLPPKGRGRWQRR